MYESITYTRGTLPVGWSWQADRRVSFLTCNPSWSNQEHLVGLHLGCGGDVGMELWSGVESPLLWQNILQEVCWWGGRNLKVSVKVIAPLRVAGSKVSAEWKDFDASLGGFKTFMRTEACCKLHSLLSNFAGKWTFPTTKNSRSKSWWQCCCKERWLT